MQILLAFLGILYGFACWQAWRIPTKQKSIVEKVDVRVLTDQHLYEASKPARPVHSQDMSYAHRVADLEAPEGHELPASFLTWYKNHEIMVGSDMIWNGVLYVMAEDHIFTDAFGDFIDFEGHFRTSGRYKRLQVPDLTYPNLPSDTMNLFASNRLGIGSTMEVNGVLYTYRHEGAFQDAYGNWIDRAGFLHTLWADTDKHPELFQHRSQTIHIGAQQLHGDGSWSGFTDETGKK